MRGWIQSSLTMKLEPGGDYLNLALRIKKGVLTIAFNEVFKKMSETSS